MRKADPHFSHLSKVSRQPHLPSLTEWAQETGVADEEGDGALCDVLRTIVQEVQTLQRTEVVVHHTCNEALQLTHVQRAWHVQTASCW